jgi:glycosyltransferase 2 family protein
MKFGWRGALGILISAACLVYVFSGINWAEVREHVRNANYALLALAGILATGVFPLRARRWRTILDPVVPGISFGPLWRSTAIGMMINNVSPIPRLGEIARGYALTREVPAVTFSTAIASLVVDRVFDAVVVLLLTAAATFASSFPAGATAAMGGFPILVVIAVAGLLGGLYGMVYFPGFFIRLFELTARRISPKLEERGSDALRKFAEGLIVLKSPKHFIAVFWWTLLHWLLQPIAFWVGFKAVGIDVPWSAALLVQGLIVISVSLPSTPGYFGLFEAAGVAGLSIYGVSATDATTWGLAFHIVSFIPITVLGAAYFARTGLTLSEISSAARGDGGDSSAGGPSLAGPQADASNDATRMIERASGSSVT